ncbi:hypothetical protein ACIHEI_32915 [Kitasatospora sp. NPDC051984]|uniref:hypothetical protein n=1 Tax=Kitasatospora sp. NPDC051984 TaxID=3364059 RepID=UPI0037C8115C
MSSFDVLVVLPPMPPEQYEAALAEVMEPYNAQDGRYDAEDPNGVPWVEELRAGGALPQGVELTWAQVADAYNAAHGYELPHDKALYLDGNGRGFWQREWNPNGQWDRKLQGRLEGRYFLHRPEAVGDPRLWNSWFEGHPDRDPLLGLPWRCDGGPRGLLDFDALRDALGRRAGEDYDAWLPGRGDDPMKWPVRFAGGRAETVAEARASAVAGFALLRLDGTWTDYLDWPRDNPEGYQQYVDAYLDAIDPDAVVLAVNCHC